MSPPRGRGEGILRAVLTAFALAASNAGAQVTTGVVDLPRAEGGTMRFLYVRPAGAVTANLVVLSGGDGYLGIQDDGTMNNPPTSTCGPITRNRDAFAAAGFAVAAMDTWPGEASIRDVIAYMQARTPAPTWVSGGSAATGAVAALATSLPASYAAGAFFYSPARMAITNEQVAAVTRPSLVAWHANDSGVYGSGLYNGLVNARVRDRLVLQGGDPTGWCGYHLFNGLDAEFVSGVVGLLREHTPALVATEAKFQALWYNAAEPGWGVNVTHQGDTLFATWFTYDAAGPMWLVMSDGRKVAPNQYQGTLYRTTGPGFSATPFDPARVTVAEAGTATFQFADEASGTFSYSVGGVSASKPITRQAFASPTPRCTAADAPSASSYQDLWWVPSESGWGLNVAHQGDTLFATWFTYAADGRGRWLVMSNLARVAGTTRFSGDIYQTAGSPFGAYDASRLVVTAVGVATLEFGAASAGTFTYTLDGVTQSKALTRQAFASPPTACYFTL